MSTGKWDEEARNQVRSAAQVTVQNPQTRLRIGEAVGILQKSGAELEEALKGLREALTPVMEGKGDLDNIFPEPPISAWVPMEGELAYMQRKMDQCLAIVREIQGRLWL